MTKPIMRVEGMDGQLELLPDRVVVHRAGWWCAFTYGFNARREIPLAAISEVYFRGATTISFGEIDFVRSGRSMEEKKRKTSSAVRFNKAKHAQFEAFKEKVFQLMEQYVRKQQ